MDLSTENVKANSTRHLVKQENINPNLSDQTLEQHTITPNPSYQNVQEQEPQPQGIFVYGALMAEEFLSWLLTGSSENHKTIVSLRQPATLRCYRRVSVVHADYPALIRGSELDKVDGFFVLLSTKSQWKKMDDFEGESYCRQRVQIVLSNLNEAIPAFVYLWQDPMDERLTSQDWDYDYFRKHRLKDWLDLFEGMEMVGDGRLFLL